MATRHRPAGAAGRRPRAARAGATVRRRSRAALPARAARPAPAVSRSALTARAAILAVAVASVVLAVALPFKVWVAQRGQINTLVAQTHHQERHIAELRHEQQRWQDPAYVRQQARVRLHYAMPGETTYVVLDKPRRQQPKAQEPAKPALTGPWYSRLWQSVQAAGTAQHPTP